jgi:predicted HD superfamily hydrolase involved in NAD metabolism
MASLDEQIVMFRKMMKKKLDPMRYEHSLSVSYTCMALAMKYGYDLKKAEIAGILHDCAKHFTDEELVARCQKHGVKLTEEELMAPAVIHAKYGAWLAQNKYGIDDEEILSAIACHTTGKPEMSMLDKIVYIADYIEPRRDKASNLPEMRELAFKDLDKTMYAILKSTLDYLEAKGATVDPMTQQAYDYFKKNRKKPGRKKAVDKEK